MSIEYREVIRSETTLHRNKFSQLPVIQSPLELPEMDGDIALLHQMCDQVLSAEGLDFMQIVRLGYLETQQDMWTDWFTEAPWPEDTVGQQIADWKKANDERRGA